MASAGSDRCGNGDTGAGNRLVPGLLRCLSQRAPAGKPDPGPARLLWRAYLSAHRQRWRVSYRLDQQRTAARRQIAKAVASSQLPVASLSYHRAPKAAQFVKDLRTADLRTALKFGGLSRCFFVGFAQ